MKRIPNKTAVATVLGLMPHYRSIRIVDLPTSSAVHLDGAKDVFKGRIGELNPHKDVKLLNAQVLKLEMENDPVFLEPVLIIFVCTRYEEY